MSDKLKITAVGCGYWGTNLIRNLDAHPRVELDGLCDSDPAALAAAAARYPEAPRLSGLEQVFTRDTQAVVIATPSQLHHGHARAALEHGLHVFVEKPMAQTVAEAKELADLAEARGLVFMVGHTFLYNNLVRDVKQRIDRGDLGELKYAYSQRLNLGRFRRDSDVMWTLAPHDVSILNYWFDALPHQVSAHGRCHLWVDEGVADVCFCLLEYPDGRSAHLHLSWMDPQKVRKMVLVGDRRMLIYDDVDSARHLQLFDKGVEREFQETTNSFADFRARLRSGDLVVPNLRLKEPLAVEIDHFVSCVLESRRPLTDQQHGLAVMAVLEALDRSMKSGGAVVKVRYEGLEGGQR